MNTLLFIHSIFRWLIVVMLIASIFVALLGYVKHFKFDKKANLLRHWTATAAHIQLIIGMLLALRSPYFTYFWQNSDAVWVNFEVVFYGLIHPTLMLTAITVLTIGSAKAKRKETDRNKYRTLLIWYTVAALLIFISIPWPFSPFSSRPLIPTF